MFILIYSFNIHLSYSLSLSLPPMIQKNYKFNFKELIGGPKFMKIHVSIHDIQNNIEMDFIPLYPYEINIRKLILGQSVEGQVRLKDTITKSIIDMNDLIQVTQIKSSESTDCSNSNSINNNIKYSQEKIELINKVNETFSKNLNLYSNNCYHFAFHYIKMSISSSLKS